MDVLKCCWDGLIGSDKVVQDATNWSDLLMHMDNITENGLVKKMFVKQGLQCKGSVPEDSTVIINYVMFIDQFDAPIDNTLERGSPRRVDLRESGLCPGFEMAITTMKKTEISIFGINYRYAFGPKGVPPRIPPKARILVAIELVDFFKAGTSKNVISSISEQEEVYTEKPLDFRTIRKLAIKEFKKGKLWSKKKEWYAASTCYGAGIELLTKYILKNEREQIRQQRLLLKLYLNQATCGLKTGRAALTCICCREALQIDPSNMKALYRFSCAKLDLEDATAAIQMTKQIIQVHPSNTQARQLLKQAVREMNQRNMIGIEHRNLGNTENWLSRFDGADRSC